MVELLCLVLALVVLALAYRLQQGPRIVEVEKIITREVLVPAPDDLAVEPEKPARQGRVKLRLMDRNERKVKRLVQWPATSRRPTIHVDGAKFMCARQDGDEWVYREVAH